MKHVISSIVLAILILALSFMAEPMPMANNDFVATTNYTIATGNSSFTVQPDGSLWAWGDNSFGQLGDGTMLTRVSPVRIMDNMSYVSSGGSHTMAISADGGLWAWGRNNFGQLGDGTMIDRLTPVLIMDDVISVSAGSSHTIAIRSDGSLWSWGGNAQGQLGDGTRTHRREPMQIMDNAVYTSAASWHTAAISSDGGLWVWGWNFYGQLGVGAAADRIIPIRIMDDVVSVSAGARHTAVIKSDDSMWAWGNNRSGQLGNGTTDWPDPRVYPEWIMDGVANVAVGDSHTLAIKTDGSLWAWGNNWWGQIGDGTISEHEPSPTPTWIMDNVAEIAACGMNSMARKDDNNLWVWGRNAFGQVGDGTYTARASPSMVHLTLAAAYGRAYNLPAMPTVATGGGSSFAVYPDGTLWAWGANFFGQLGDGTTMSRHDPVQIMDNVIGISAGDGYALAIQTDGNLWGWGDNRSGQIGDGTDETRLNPVLILDGVAYVSAGVRHTLAIRKDGSLWAWGDNTFGQLGDGMSGVGVQRLSPVRVTDDIIGVSAGRYHSAAIRSDGSLWTWGKNDVGQLGNGGSTTTEYSVPSPEWVMNEVTAISAGDGHTLAIRTDGSLWAWGDNSAGQLGDGTHQVRRLRPVRIMDGVVSVDAGRGHSMAILTDGILKGWGFNMWGQLGEGTRTRQPMRQMPIWIMEEAVAVSAGGTHTIATHADGSLWAWGDNRSGQLGEGISIQRNTPTRIKGSVMLFRD